MVNLNFKVKYDNIASQDSKMSSLRPFSPMVNTDEDRLMQILFQLQSNAIKFTQEGSITIHVKKLEE